MHAFRRFPTLCALMALGIMFTAPAPAADLVAPQIAPINPFIPIGSTLRLTATGTFSDASTRLLSNATIAAGGNHVCALPVNGEVRCWGRGTSGQLGNNASADSAVPVVVSGIDNGTAVAAGGDSSCALRADGTVACWGLNNVGQLGNGTTGSVNFPVVVTGLTAVAIAAGFRHACAVLASGALRCWGGNNAGQLGNGLFTGATTPVIVSGISTAIEVATGGNHSCALLATRTVRCWGDNAAGQLGNGTFTGSPTPVNVTGIVNATAITAGFDHSCALLAGGTVSCWGRGLEGQLGNGAQANSPTPVTVPPTPLRAVALAAGISHTCAALEGGVMLCWGDNGNGQLGNGVTTGKFPSPGAVVGISKVVAVTAGFSHSCAVLANGDTRCWGLNDGGQLGTGVGGSTLQRSGSQLTVSGPALLLDAGGHHTCAGTPTGIVNCWGSGSFGQLGDNRGTDSLLPVTVEFGAGPPNVVSLGLGQLHSCATLANGTARCWGSNDHGQLGINQSNVPSRLIPDSVSNMTTAASVASGDQHSCVVLADASVKCWGSNTFGAVGDSFPGSNITFPVTVAGISTATRVVTGGNHSCARLSSGSVQCWGRGNEGQLGNGALVNSFSPVTVTGITTATSLALGAAHSCARLVGGSVRCWGRNVEGQLGNSSTTGSAVPVVVTGLTTASSVAAGDAHSCATTSTGGVNCWGAGFQGQLGNGFFLNVSAPVVASGIAGAVAVTAGSAHSCALLSNGRARCWGTNDFGELGNGEGSPGTFVATPVAVTGINMDTAALAWSSNNTAVATVDMSGHVRAVGIGTAEILARYDTRARSGIVTVEADTDADGIADRVDNCTLVSNPDQFDADGDFFGNPCDGDLNNSGLVTVADFGLLRSVLNQRATASALAAAADMNVSGLVTASDFSLLRAALNQPPGPAASRP